MVFGHKASESDHFVEMVHPRRAKLVEFLNADGIKVTSGPKDLDGIVISSRVFFLQ